MKKTLSLLLCIALILALTACTRKEGPSAAEPGGSAGAKEVGNLITLTGDSAETGAKDVIVSGRTVTVTAGGEYTVTGTLNGQLIVNTGETAERVTLTFSGAHITNETDAALYVQQAEKLKLVLAPDTENSLISGVPGTEPGEDANGAALFSEDDLDIEGEGRLEIIGYINNGITCKDDLTVQGGIVSVSAVNNGLRGTESVRMEDGSVTVVAGGDGVKSTSAKKEGKGYISVSGGALAVNAGGDGLEAAAQVLISGGTLSVITDGDPELGSSKGLKAETGILVEGGTVNVESTDHGFRSGTDIELRGGTLDVASSMGRGLTARGEVRLTGDCALSVYSVEDGIRADTDVIVSAGTVSIASGEDGIHAGDSLLGVGTVTISGGSLLISGYEDGIDAKAKLLISGGNVLAVSRAQKLKSFSPESTAPYLGCTISAPSRSEVTVSAEDGAVLGRMTATYGFTQLIFSADSLSHGQSCTVSADGNAVTVTAE